MSPLVSVIIPTYRRPDLLVRAVDSVKSQTYNNIEIIIVDDENNSELINFFDDDKEIKILTNETNRGACYSRNKGLKYSRGLYINFLDDDDVIFPNKIEEQVRHFLKSNNSKLGMVTCHTNDIRSGKGKIVFNRVRGYVYKDLLKKFLISGTETVLYLKDALNRIQGFDESLEANHEYDLLIRMSEFYEIDYIDKVLSERYKSENQISVNFEKKIKGANQLFRKHKKRYRKEGLRFYVYMKVKEYVLYIRFYMGKAFGTKFYFRLIR